MHLFKILLEDVMKSLEIIVLQKTFYFKSVELEPTNENCWLSLIIFLVSQKKFKKAKLYLEKSLIINGDSIELWKNNVELCIKPAEEKRYINHVKNFLVLAITNLMLLLKLLTFSLKKKLEKHKHHSRKCLFSFCPNNRNLEIRIAGCCFHLNKIDEAIYLLNLNQMDKKDKKKIFLSISRAKKCCC